MHNRLAMKLPRSRWRSEEHTSELQSQSNLVCRLLLEKLNTCIPAYGLHLGNLHVHTDSGFVVQVVAAVTFLRHADLVEEPADRCVVLILADGGGHRRA